MDSVTLIEVLGLVPCDNTHEMQRTADTIGKGGERWSTII